MSNQPLDPTLCSICGLDHSDEPEVGPRFPDVTANLIDHCDFAPAIVEETIRALTAAGHTDAAREYEAETSHVNEDHAFWVAMKYVAVA